jgi:large subunit ribosomal protein L6
MSRIGKKPIELPKGVNVTVEGNRVTVKGPKGELSREIHPEMILAQEDGNLSVSRPSEERRHQQLHGLTHPDQQYGRGRQHGLYAPSGD